MTDPESRDPVFRDQTETPLFIYQVEYPIGTIFCIAAHSVSEAAGILSLKDIEPFMIRRAGLFLTEEG